MDLTWFVTLNKQFFFLQLTDTGYDEINSTHADGNEFEVHGGDGQQGTATPIQGHNSYQK